MRWLFNSCRRYRRDICLLASGVLTGPESGEVQKHLAACPDCRSYFEEMKAVATTLADWKQASAQLQPTQTARHRWARAVQSVGRPEPVRRTTPAMAYHEWCRDVLWPCRRIWTGLATIWLAILVGNVSLGDNNPRTLAAKSSRPSQEMIMALKDRQNILAELLADHFELHDADRQKFFLPKPRTERVLILTL